MNMAVVLKLPTVFVFENNGFGEATGHDYAVGGRDIANRAASFGMPAVKVDGTDFFAVYEAVAVAVERARNGEGPSAIEAVAHRWHGHFEGDPMLYRADGEVERLRRDNDPLQIFSKQVEGQISAEELQAIDDEVQAQVDDAVAKARIADYPSVDNLLTDVYVSY